MKIGFKNGSGIESIDVGVNNNVRGKRAYLNLYPNFKLSWWQKVMLRLTYIKYDLIGRFQVRR